MSDPASGVGTAPKIERVEGAGIPIRGNDIDTDQIIPARFLKVVTFEGMGRYAFYDRRFDEAGDPKDHPFNERHYQGSTVLVVNANFGCGSSREHAPQALQRWGIEAIVGESFADIFAGNCLALGLPTVTADRDGVRALQAWVEDNPTGAIEIDLVAETVSYDDVSVACGMNDAQRKALLEGVWDTTALLRSNAAATREVAERLPYVEDR